LGIDISAGFTIPYRDSQGIVGKPYCILHAD